MKLHEYQSKKIFSKYNLPCPFGYVVNKYNRNKNWSEKIGSGPWVLKCQIHAGGRGKSGGVKLVNSIKEINNFIDNWLEKRLVTNQTDDFGQPVNDILIENSVDINKELYLSILIDRSKNNIVVISSNYGGINIEEFSLNKKNILNKVYVDILIGPQLYQGRELAFKLGLYGNAIEQFTQIFVSLVLLFIHNDLELVEINPLVLTNSNELICLDAKIILDNNSIFRQNKLKEMRDYKQEDYSESESSKYGLNYVRLNGNIGCMVNGAGLAMATMDMIKLYGGNPANFLDVGGNTTSDQVSEGFKIILSDSNVKIILINIFGGIVKCDIIANGIINALYISNIKIPLIIRLEGNRSDLGIKLLKNKLKNIIAIKNLNDAVKKAIFIAEKK